MGDAGEGDGGGSCEDDDARVRGLLGRDLARYEAHRGAMPAFVRYHMASQLLCAVRSISPRSGQERQALRDWIEHLLATQRAEGHAAGAPPLPWAGLAAEPARPFRIIPGALYAYDLDVHGYMRHPNRYDRWVREYAATGTPPGYASDPDLDMSAYDDPLTDEEEAAFAPLRRGQAQRSLSATPRVGDASPAPPSHFARAPQAVSAGPAPYHRDPSFPQAPPPPASAAAPRKRRRPRRTSRPASELFATLGRCSIVRATEDGRLVAERVRGQSRELVRVQPREGEARLECYALGRAVGPPASAQPAAGFAVFFGGFGGDVARFARGLRRTVVSRAAACPHLFHVVAEGGSAAAPLPEDLVVVSADWSSLAGFAPRGPADLFDGVVSPLGRPRCFAGIDSLDALLAAFQRYFRAYVARYG